MTTSSGPHKNTPACRKRARGGAKTGGTGRRISAYGSHPAQTRQNGLIIADTSVWVDHFRKSDAHLYLQLQRNNISIHPFIVAELALGNLPNRLKTIARLDLLPMAKVAQMGEVRNMVEAHALFQRGIGFVDAHLIASTLITPHTTLWSRDKRLRDVAANLGVDAKVL